MSGGRIEAQFTPSGASLSATNSGGGPTSVSIPSVALYISTLCSTLQSTLQATRPPSTGSWTVALSTGPSGTGKVSITCTGTWSIAWTSATLRDILGFTADLTSVTGTQTGTNQARGLFMPGVPLAIDSDPDQDPQGSDFRATINPQGGSFALVGTTFYRHRNLRYSGINRNKTWTNKESTVNESWQTFFKETQLGLSSSWFSVQSPLKFYYDNAGSDSQVGTYAYKLVKPPGLDDLGMRQSGWVGRWDLNLGDVYADGT